MDREPAVAGRFYPADRAALAAEVASFLAGAPPSGPAAPSRRRSGARPTEPSPRPPGGAAQAPAPEPAVAVPALGLMAPHAGYFYSGAVAGATYARVVVPDRVVVLCPNHTGRGERVSLWPGGSWRTPLGDVPVDEATTAALLESGAASPDVEAHRLEHALEVQLPFLQTRNPRVSISALCLGPLSWPACRELGLAVARASAARGALVVASSDMSHYLPAAVARRKDEQALERLLALDPRGLHEVVLREDISMCGFVPATVMLVAALERGARRAELVRYGHSGEASGDDDAVVGYAGVVVR
jgi:AmmeMemoRadiSam system protein B